MINRPRMTLLTALSMLLPAMTTAQEMGLQASVEYALQHNPELHAAEQQVAVAKQQLASVEAASSPVVSLSYSARVSDNPLDAFADKLFTRQVTAADFQPAALNEPGSSDLHMTSLSLKWPVYTGGKIEAQKQQTGIAVQQSRLMYQRAQQKIAYHTVQAYLFAVATQKAIAVADQAVEAAQQHADTTARLAAEGRIVESDKLAAEVNLAAVKAQQAQAVTRHKHALTRLRQVMGMTSDADIAIQYQWPQHPLLQQQAFNDIEQLIKQAMKNRVDLQAAQQAVAAAGAGIDVASADKKPTVALVASSNWYDDSPGFDSQSSSLMAVASINLYDGTTDGKVGVAKAQQKEQQWRKQSLQQTIQSEVKQAWDDLQEAMSRFDIARDNVARAKKAVRLVKKRYGQGRTILLDLLQSERMYTESRIEKLTSELNLRTSRLALRFAVGDMPAMQEITQ